MFYTYIETFLTSIGLKQCQLCENGEWQQNRFRKVDDGASLYPAKAVSIAPEVGTRPQALRCCQAALSNDFRAPSPTSIHHCIRILSLNSTWLVRTRLDTTR